SLLIVCAMGSGVWGQSVRTMPGSQPLSNTEAANPSTSPTVGFSPLPMNVTQPPQSPDNSPVTLSPELEPFLERVGLVDDEPIVPIEMPPLPAGFEPWWMPQIAKPLRPKSRPVPVTVEWLTWRALDHSPQVLAMNLDPTIRETEIVVQQAEFDWQAFVDSA